MRNIPLELETADGSVRPVSFGLKRMVNAGYVGRDQAAVKAHVDELAEQGVPAPPEIPMLFPVLSTALSTADRIEVVGGQTSGEVEYVLLHADGEVWVGVGSDHTDRRLESFDLILSKQICPNVMAPRVWRLADVESHWDQLVMRSWVDGGDDLLLYQDTALAAILSPEELLGLIRPKLVDGDLEGLAVFSGTVAVQTEGMVFGSMFRGELIDPILNRRLAFEYQVDQLNFLKTAALG